MEVIVISKVIRPITTDHNTSGYIGLWTVGLEVFQLQIEEPAEEIELEGLHDSLSSPYDLQNPVTGPNHFFKLGSARTAPKSPG
ncbi:WD40 repeat-containing protein (plasmid) [Pseudomonas putida]|uniref:WD40 repeat-containing protein n=1 Tax=Pseudomonas putida TaxID=303 RepID=A0A1L7NMX3_PSEPU|nr:WD40 repeat-containing protein [Pseudomonas putida]